MEDLQAAPFVFLGKQFMEVQKIRIKVIDASLELGAVINSRLGLVDKVDEWNLVVKEEAGVGAQREGSAGRVQVAGYATLDRVFLEIVRDGEGLA